MRTFCYCLILVVFFLEQLLLTAKARRIWVKCIPAMLVLGWMVACFVAYAISGWTNWGWLILMLLTGGVLLPVALAAVLAQICGKNQESKK